MKNEPIRTDWLAFSVASLLVIAVCAALIANPEVGAQLLPAIYGFVAETLGPGYLLLGALLIIFLLWLALGRFGQVRLGGVDAKPEFSTGVWAHFVENEWGPPFLRRWEVVGVCLKPDHRLHLEGGRAGGSSTCGTTASAAWTSLPARPPAATPRISIART